MSPDEVPASLVDLVYDAKTGVPPRQIRRILAAVLPAHEAMIREQAAARRPALSRGRVRDTFTQAVAHWRGESWPIRIWMGATLLLWSVAVAVAVAAAVANILDWAGVIG